MNRLYCTEKLIKVIFPSLCSISRYYNCSFVVGTCVNVLSKSLEEVVTRYPSCLLFSQWDPICENNNNNDPGVAKMLCSLPQGSVIETMNELLDELEGG